jgi:hypothetical protein
VAHINDVMREALAAYYGLPDASLGDLMALLRDEDPTFQGGARREWYAARLDDLVVEYEAEAHLADLALLLWSEEDPLGGGGLVASVLILESGDTFALESGGSLLLEAG